MEKLPHVDSNPILAPNKKFNSARASLGRANARRLFRTLDDLLMHTLSL